MARKSSTHEAPLTIGVLAERSGRSVHTLRYYERIGLIPRVERDDGGRRLYRSEHVHWLAFLDRLRATGMSIASMREYASLVSRGDGTFRARLRLLQRHRESVLWQIEELEGSVSSLDAKIRFYRECMRQPTKSANGRRGKPKIDELYQRWTATLDKPSSAQRA